MVGKRTDNCTGIVSVKGVVATASEINVCTLICLFTTVWTLYYYYQC